LIVTVSPSPANAPVRINVLKLFPKDETRSDLIRADAESATKKRAVTKITFTHVMNAQRLASKVSVDYAVPDAAMFKTE